MLFFQHNVCFTKIMMVFLVLMAPLLFQGCGSGGGGSAGDTNPIEKPVSLIGPVPDVTDADLNNSPDHNPFIFKQVPVGFYNTRVLPDGRLVGTGLLDASEQVRMFSAKSGVAGFNLLTPNGINGGRFSYSRNTAVYLHDFSLFSIDSVAPIKISGDEVVENFWLSENEKKVFFIANNKFLRIFDEGTGKYNYVERNQLFMVDLMTGVRIQFGKNNPNSYVIFNDDRHNPQVHVTRPRLLPNESRVVYVINNEKTGKTELHSASADGTNDIVLNGSVVSGIDTDDAEDIFIYAFSPNSSKIIYGVTSEDSVELYSINPDGGLNTKVSGEISFGLLPQSKNSIDITSDSSRLLFIAGEQELYSVGLDGSGLVKLSNEEVVSGFILSLSPQSNIVIYSSDKIFSVPVSGGASMQLSNGFDFNAISELAFADNDQSVVYMDRDSDTNDVGLYLTKLDGSSTINLSGAASSNGGLARQYKKNTFMIDQEGGMIVYRASSEQQYDTAIYAVKLDGTNRIKLTPDKLHDQSALGQMIGFYENKFYFIYEKNRRSFTEIYAFYFENNAIENVSGVWPEFVAEDADYFQGMQSETGLVQAFTTDSVNYSSVAIQVLTASSECRIDVPDNLFIVDGPANMIMEPSGNNLYYTVGGTNGFEFYKVNTNTCNSIAINDGSGDRVERVKLSPDEMNIVYTTNSQNLIAASNDGTEIRVLNNGGVKRINNGAFSISPDSSRIIYWADQDAAGIYELYSVTMDGLSTNKINGPLFVGGQVFTAIFAKFSPEISMDSQWVVYKAQQESLDYQLYKSRLDGSENTLLSGGVVNSKLYFSSSTMSKITADSSKVVYLTRDNTTNSLGLYVSNLVGMPLARPLTPDFQQGGGVSAFGSNKFSLTSDSQAVVYFSRENAESPYDIFSVRLDGSGRVKLNQEVAENGRIINYKISEDNSTVVYQINTPDVNVTGLYVSNLDGTGKTLIHDNVSGVLYGNKKPIFINDGKVVFRAVIGGVDGVYTKLLSGGVATLIFEVPEGRDINKMFLTANNKINIFGDFRQLGVSELFSFDL